MDVFIKTFIAAFFVAVVLTPFVIIWMRIRKEGVAGAFYPGLATAAQLSELKDKIDEQQRLLEEIQRELEELKKPTP